MTSNPSTALPVLANDTLDGRAERFATLYAGGTDATTAYKQCYDVAPTTLANTVHRLAHRLRHSAPVAGRIRALQTAAAQAVVFDITERAADLLDIATADAGELCRVVVESCRACRGIDGKPQWRDPAELQRAVERTQASRLGPKPEPMPEFGGFDFDPALPPVDGCAGCGGHGLARVVLTPSSDWSPAARKLFKSARQKADGSIEIETHNQLAASEQLGRLLGWFVERRETKALNVSMSAAEAAEIAARPVDEIVKLLFKRKDATT